MEFSNRDHVAGVSPLYENVCRFLSEHGSVPPADSSDADPEEVYPSISGNSGVESGLIFLGSGGSASIPQLNHVLAFSDAHHPFYRFARGEAVLPALPVMQQQAIEYRQRLKRLQVEAASKQPTALCASSDPAVSGCNGVSTNAATGEHETPTLSASDLRDLELKAMDARNAACPTCLKAFLYPNNRNGRRNISLLLSVEKKRLLIDCGKTLRDSVISFCCPFQISSVDAVFLTHDHMDAVGGLDDLRDMQPFDRLTLRSLSAGEALGSRDERAVTRWYAPKEWISCFLGARTFASVSRSYSYLLRPYIERGSGGSSKVTAQTAAQTAAACQASDCIVKETEDGEFALTNTGRLLLRRKVACIDFHILNDTVVSAASPAAAAEAAAKVSAAAAATMQTAVASLPGGVPRPLGCRDTVVPAVANAGKGLQQQQQQQCDDSAAAAAAVRVGVVDDWGFSRLELQGVRTPIFSFPVYHGGSYVCLGLMSLGAEPFLLLSDVTAVPAVVLQRLLELPRPEVMVVDAIGERPHAAHFSLQEALDLGVLLQPRRLLFVGMDCCLEHNLTNRRLQVWLTQHREMYRAVNGRESRIQEVRLAHDGLFLAFNTGAA
ncbi:uncharacterized protein LOC34619120 [Cyclospora cayetanensis]|uniref:Uncharacterized protein LOC34619120 n=1 Tax=Cyclospora cayetanensis TaxID=88456 RepID=A0A6P6S0J6_9EIME|nr:uncharacterized protein LOC34619120 [Cyclospora cayetanensis]